MLGAQLLGLVRLLGRVPSDGKEIVSGLDGIDLWSWIGMFLKKEDINWSK